MDQREKARKVSPDSVLSVKNAQKGAFPAHLGQLPDQIPVKPLARRRDGTFPKGPHPQRARGRPVGTKNKITLLRLDLEEALRTQLKGDGLEILQKAIAMAKNGNEKVMKVLLDKMLASPKGDDASEAKDNDVRITIQNLTHGEQVTQVASLPKQRKEDS